MTVLTTEPNRLLDLQYSEDQGTTYEDRYGGWLGLFKEVAESKEPLPIYDAPPTWQSLIYYLGGEVDARFSAEVWCIDAAEASGRLRELVEKDSVSRPELVDALYKSDVEWDTVNRRHQWQREFAVTCNGSFFRPEVLDYLAELSYYRKPEHIRNCVLVPCAADKPYPAPLHSTVESLLPGDGTWHLIIATGVLGLVPRELWDIMPLYDSGLPNQWRLMLETEKYFLSNRYDRIVVYSDFYNEAIMRARPHSARPVEFVNPNVDHYLPLLSDTYLERLRVVLSDAWKAD